MRQLRLARGEWRLIAPNAPARLVSRINRREHPDLQSKRGHLEAQIRNGYRDELGRRRGDVWARFIPE